MNRLLCICLILLTTPALSDHIVGGELQMNHLGNYRFGISLIQFWDRNNLIIPTITSNGNRDNAAIVFIYNKRTGAYMDQVTLTYDKTSEILYQNKACATYKSLSTSVGVYLGSITLNPSRYNDPDGYYMVWERCCRNGDISNINEPQTNGIVFYLEFPPVTTNNSSPQFQLPDGKYICTNTDFTMNMSATDGDGDILKYSLVTPLRGYTSTRQANGDNTVKNGYPEIIWANGFSAQTSILGSKPLTIDQNGMLSVNTNTTGLFVFAVQCEEYRNGKRIGIIRRDFQLMVIDCDDEAPSPSVIKVNELPVEDVSFCEARPVELTIEAEPGWTYQWQKDGSNISGATAASLMVTDTGNYAIVKSYTVKCTRDTVSAPVRVHLKAPPSIHIASPQKGICSGDTIKLDGIVDIPNRVTYRWYHDDVMQNDSSVTLEITRPGNYKLTGTDAESGCSAEDSVYISPGDLFISVEDTLQGNEGKTISIKPAVSPDDEGNQYAWTITGDPNYTANTKDLTVNLSSDVSYTLSALSRLGCRTSASVFIRVLSPIHIPSAFTPNSDGINDTFEIYNAQGRIEEVFIYNRWGTVIYSSNGYDTPWDGSSKNASADTGSYPYIIKTVDQTYRGEIMLIR
jgi:gliding motility-associated-like protein